MTQPASRTHSHRYLHAHGERWLCVCGKEMDESDMPASAPSSDATTASCVSCHLALPIGTRAKVNPDGVIICAQCFDDLGGAS